VGGISDDELGGNKCVKVEEENKKYGKCEMSKEEVVKLGKYTVKKVK
jgi:hypothetical protein